MADTRTSVQEVYVFDSALPDLQTLVDAVGPDKRIIILNHNSDGVLQLASELAHESGLSAIHLFSHGAVGSLQLGSAALNLNSMPEYTTALAQIGHALSDSGDLLLYGCNVGQGDAGQAFIAQLADATGADVAASDDMTGAAALGGNWQLEQISGVLEASPVEAPFYLAVLPYTQTSTFFQNIAINQGVAVNANNFGMYRAMFDIAVASYWHKPGLNDIPTMEAPEITDFISAEAYTQLKLSGLRFDITNAELRLPAYITTNTLVGEVSNSIVYKDGFYTAYNTDGIHQSSVALIGRTDTALFISFRGSDVTGDWLDDFGISGTRYNMGIHYDRLRALIDSIKNNYLPENSEIRDIYIAGHSLGGEMAALFMHENKDNDPAWNNVKFHAITYEAANKDLPSTGDDRYVNFEMRGDPVPDLSGLTSIFGKDSYGKTVHLDYNKIVIPFFSHKVGAIDEYLNTVIKSLPAPESLAEHSRYYADDGNGVIATNYSFWRDLLAGGDHSSYNVDYFGAIFSFLDVIGVNTDIAEKIYEIATKEDNEEYLKSYLPDGQHVYNIAWQDSGPHTLIIRPFGDGYYVLNAADIQSVIISNDTWSTSANFKIDAHFVAHDVYLMGNDANNFLAGGGGNDVLVGNGDEDTLSGGAGDDVLFGGDFKYNNPWFIQLTAGRLPSGHIPIIKEFIGSDFADDVSYMWGGPGRDDFVTSGDNDYCFIDVDFAASAGWLDTVWGFEPDAALSNSSDFLVFSAAEFGLTVSVLNSIADQSGTLLGQPVWNINAANFETDETYSGTEPIFFLRGDFLFYDPDGEGAAAGIAVTLFNHIDGEMNDIDGSSLLFVLNYESLGWGQPAVPNYSPTLSGIPLAPEIVSVGQIAALADFTVDDANGPNATLSVTLVATNGTLNNLTDVNVNAAGIQLTGTAAHLNAAISGATFTATSPVDVSISVSVTDGVISSPIVGTYSFIANGGNDSIVGGAGNDTIDAGPGNDTVNGNDGNDFLYGGEGGDSLIGGAGDDYLFGDAGADILHGEDGNDNLFDSGLDNADDDYLYGDAGNDTLTSKGGNDRMYGGSGSDTYSFESTASYVAIVSDQGDGNDLLRIKSPDADFTKTSFLVSGSDLVIHTYTSSGSSLRSAVIVDMAHTAGQIETLEIDQGTGTGNATGRYNLLTAWSAALAGDDTGGAAFVGSFIGGIYTGDGNDSVTGTPGNDVIFGHAGNDTINGLGGSDNIDGGSGKDTITITNGVVDGGLGDDTVTVTGLISGQTGVAINTYWSVTTSAGVALPWLGFNATNAEVSAALSTGQTWDYKYFSTYYGPWVTQFSLKNVENWNVLAGSSLNDLLVVRGTGTRYDGGAGIDALYADWGSATNAITWTNAPGATQLVNGVTFSGFERMLITTGSGNDLIDNSYAGNGTSDYIDTGAGNDTINGGAGADTVISGSGNDTITVLAGVVNSGSGNDTITITNGVVDGGLGDDTVTVTGLISVATGVTLNTYWSVTTSAGVALPWLGSNATYEEVSAALSTGQTWDYKYFSNYYGPWVTQLTLENVENWNVLAGSSLNDLLVVRGTGTRYDGGAGIDALYADWGSATNAITWVNAPGVTQLVNGVTLSGLERMLITTGSGNDRIDNSYAGNGTDDYIATGAGNDTINGGMGNDTILGGDGNDMIIIADIKTNGLVDGGSGNDTVSFSLASGPLSWWGTGDYTGWRASNAAGATVADLNYGSSYSEIAAALASAATISFENIEYPGGSMSGGAWTPKLALKNIENWNVLEGSTFHDLLIVHGIGTSYDGAGSIDTLYADWSSVTHGITWVNTPAIVQIVNGHTLSGLERMLITTGSGNDLIDNSYAGNGTDDYIDAGAGNDTINGGAGSDTILGGDGTDTLNLDWSKAATGEQDRHMVFMLQKSDGAWVKFGVVADATAGTIDNLLVAFAASPAVYRYQDRLDSGENYWGEANSMNVIWSGIEKVNVKGSDGGATPNHTVPGNDFIVYQNGQTYAGGGGWDQFFADWSGWTESVRWTNGADNSTSARSDNVATVLGASHQVSVSGMERLLLLTGSGDDTIVQNVVGTNDEFRLGAGNDTYTEAVNDNSNDFISMGAGDDVVNLKGLSSAMSSQGNDADTIDGGAGTDTLNLDWSNAAAGEQDRHLVFMLQKSDGAWVKFGAVQGATAATIDSLQTALSASPKAYRYQDLLDSGEYYWGDAYSMNVIWSGIEKVNVKGSDGGSAPNHSAPGNDFIVYQNGQTYAGGGGWDQFFADWSGWTESVRWTNGADSSTSTRSDNVATVLGASHQVSVSGMERLLLLTGSGDDTIVQNVVGTNDEFRLGAGNDTVFGNSGDDTIDGGTGQDTAQYSGLRSEYTISLNSATHQITITDTVANRDGVDTVRSIERFSFLDQSIDSPIPNSAPRLAIALVDQQIERGASSTYILAPNSFIDDDADPLTYSARLGDTTPLPSWLQFNPGTKAFTVQAGRAVPGNYTIEVRASDALGSTSDTFTYTVGNTLASRQFAGVVQDGYVAGARLYIDRNANAIADPEEDTGLITDSQGNFSGTLYGQGALIAVGGTNIDTGLSNTMVLRAPEGATVISPITTLLSQYMQDSAASVSEARSSVLSAFGLPGTLDVLSFDALAASPNDPNALAVQKLNAQLAVTATLSGSTSTVMSGIVTAMDAVAGSVASINLTSPSVLTQVAGLTGTQAATLAQNNTAIQSSTNIGQVSESQLAAIQTNAGTTDLMAPQVSSYLPANQASGVAIGQDLKISFNEAIQIGSGDITLKTSAGVVLAHYTADSANLAIAGNTLTINPSADLAFLGNYVLDIAPGALTDLAGNAYIGSASYQFTTLTNQVPAMAYSWKAHTLLEGVSITTAAGTQSTGADGQTSLSGVTGASVALTASRAIPTGEAAATSSAVNLQDAIAILKMIVGLDVNGAGKPLSPYQTLAADFDGNGTVGLNDAIGVLKHVVGLASPEPTWHFLNEADPTVPGKVSLSPGQAATTLQANITGTGTVHVGLVGYLSGDVDGSYAGAAAAKDLDEIQPNYFASLVESQAGLTPGQFGVYA